MCKQRRRRWSQGQTITTTSQKIIISASGWRPHSPYQKIKLNNKHTESEHMCIRYDLKQKQHVSRHLIKTWITAISGREWPLFSVRKFPPFCMFGRVASGRIGTGDELSSLWANWRVCVCGRGELGAVWDSGCRLTCRLTSHRVFLSLQHMATERKLQAKRKLSNQSSLEHQILLIW